MKKLLILPFVFVLFTSNAQQIMVYEYQRNDNIRILVPEDSINLIFMDFSSKKIKIRNLQDSIILTEFKKGTRFVLSCVHGDTLGSIMFKKKSILLNGNQYEINWKGKGELFYKYEKDLNMLRITGSTIKKQRLIKIETFDEIDHILGLISMYHMIVHMEYHSNSWKTSGLSIAAGILRAL